MKKFLICFFSAASLTLSAQAPGNINYQGVVRDQSGAPISTLSTIGVKFEIGDGSNTIVHSETQNAVPVNSLGLFSTKIGLTSSISNTISWQNGPYTLSVSINTGAGFSFMGSQEFASVPYALYALRAGNALPVGTRQGQTLRWDSVPGQWVVDNNLTNDGAHVGIGLFPAGLKSRLHVTTNSLADTSVVFGAHGNVPPRGAGMRGLVVGNTVLSNDPFATAIYGGQNSAVNQGSGLAVGTYGFANSNGMSVGLLGIGAAAPSGTAAGLFATSAGPPSNSRYAAVFDKGNVVFNDSIYIAGTNTVGASPGNVLTLSSTGRAKWAPVPGGIFSIITQGPVIGGPITNTGTISLAPSGVTAQGYGNITSYPTFTVDTYGRITNAGNLLLPASVTTINTTAPLSGGPITSSGTISLLPSGVSAGAYGASPATVPIFTVDTYGRLTNAGSYSLAVPPSTLNGDVNGTFLTTTVTAIQGTSVSAATPTNGQVLQFNGGTWGPTTLPAAAWIKTPTTVTLAANTDNVGIGSPSPAEKLQIETGGNTQVSIISPVSNTGHLLFGVPANHLLGSINYHTGNHDMTFGTNGISNRVRLFGNGDVAIGGTVTPNPVGSFLNISKPGPNNTKVLISGGDNSNTYGGMLALGENATGTQGFAIKLDAGANRLWFTNDVNGSNPVMVIGGYAGANAGVNIGSGLAGNQAPLNGLGVQGFLGVGTSGPGERIHAIGSSSERIKVESTSGMFSSEAIFQTDNNGLNTFGIFKGGSGISGSIAGGIPLANLSHIYAGTNAGGMLLNVINNNPMYFATNSMERMRIAASGFVGIGTTTPTAPLDVNGTVRIGGANSNELNRTQTGDANLVPVAFGNITGGGGINANGTTTNVTLASHTANSGTYYFNIGGESIFWLDHTCIATLNGTNGEISWNSSGGQLVIFTYNSSGTLTDKPFTFVIYKK